MGSSATFICNATSIPGQNFTWMKQEQMERITSDAQRTIVSVTGSSQLINNNINVSDHGYYVCDATVNAKQKNSATAYLQVATSKFAFMFQLFIAFFTTVKVTII